LLLGVQACPAALQVEPAPHVPVDEPGLMLQARPAQQSAGVVQVPP
jgi:hypothetical protein